jgi:hypothetical protein
VTLDVTPGHVAALAALVAAVIVLRPEVWTRVFFAEVDPRPAALMRIALGLVTLWTFVVLGLDLRTLFTDEGLLLPGAARDLSRGPLRHLWDPAHGFEHWWSPLLALMGNSSVLHLRSDPAIVSGLYGLLLVSLALMIVGAWTGPASVVTWALAEQFYRYDPMPLNGGDLVIRALLFLGMFCRWGEAYSVDSAWRARRAQRQGTVATLRGIPAWPLRLMMVQLAIVYAANGWLKTGAAWQEGTALYYALNLDHFYRVPAQGLVTWLQYLGVLPVMTWLTSWWERLFPLALLGAALRGYEADRIAGRWPPAGRARRLASWAALALAWGMVALLAGDLAAAAGRSGATIPILVTVVPAGLVVLYRIVRVQWPSLHRLLLAGVLGKRLWLGLGVAVHLGIDLGMNVGTFPQVMLCGYLAWLSGGEVAAGWRALRVRAPLARHRLGPA